MNPQKVFPAAQGVINTPLALSAGNSSLSRSYNSTTLRSEREWNFFFFKCKQSQAKEVQIKPLGGLSRCGAVVLRTCGKGRDLAPGPCPSPTGQHYLELGQLLAVVEDAEGVEVVRARVWDHLTAHQAEGLLGRLAPVPVLVEVQVTVPDRAPARLPLAVHQHIQVTCGEGCS